MSTDKCRGYAGKVPVYCSHDKIIPVGDVKPNPKNPNQHPEEQIKILAKIITTQGWRAPVTVSTLSGLVVRGHGRLMAAKYAGLKFVPVDLQHYDSMDAELADLLADNKIAELAEIDNKLLADVFADIDLDAMDVDLTGYTEDEYKSIVSALTEATQESELKDPDAEVAPPKVLTTKPGDLWRLGRHRLVCGDSTNRQTILTLLEGQKADLVFTDPPYGMKKEADGVANDNLNYDDLLEFNKRWVPITFDALKENGSWYCWGIDEPLMDIYCHILRPMMRENRITFRNLITWKKENDNPTMLFNGACASNNRSFYTNEKCLFVMCGVQGFNNNSDNYFEQYEPVRQYLEEEAKKAGIGPKEIKQICGVGMYAHWFTKSQWDLMTESHYKKIQEYCIKAGINAFGVEFGEIKKQYDEIKKQWYETRAYFDGTASQCIDVWVHDVTNQKERDSAGGHATPKPIALCGRAIKSSSREGETVLDVFGGSGSTLIACEQFGRIARLVELEPKWCDTIVSRYMKVTGKTDVVLVRDGKEIPVAETGILN